MSTRNSLFALSLAFAFGAGTAVAETPGLGKPISEADIAAWNIEVLPDGKSYRFYFLQEVKSFITNPSPGLTMKEPGYYEISGVAYSGTGRITKVMVSADGGKSWGESALQGPVHPQAFARFRMPWRWDGQPVVLQSRAWDEAGNV